MFSCLAGEMSYLLDLVIGVKVDDLAKGLLQSCNVFFHDFRVCESEGGRGSIVGEEGEGEIKKKGEKMNGNEEPPR